MKRASVVSVVILAVLAASALAQIDPAAYAPRSQADLVSQYATHAGKKVQVEGTFVFAGSDFCYQIRKTKINTKDYFCFALGPTSLLRLYLKKDHAQADQLLNLKKGERVQAFGTFDSQGGDFNYLVVDGIAVGAAK